MKSTLTVKNFGPIIDATLDLRNVNVLIGPQASGKSTLAKLYTICKSPLMYHDIEGGKFSSVFYKVKELKHGFESKYDLSIQKFKTSLEHFSISDFFTNKTEIKFDCPTHCLNISNGRISFEDKIDITNLLKFFKEKNIEKIKDEFNLLREKSDRFDFTFIFDLFYHREKAISSFDDFFNFFKNFDKYDLTLQEAELLIDSVRFLKSDIFNNKALYIPAERTIINLLMQASFSLQKAKVPLPSHLLDYASIYQNATLKVKKLDLGFLKTGTTYRNINGVDKIYFSPRKSIRLTESASGFQSVIPMILPIQNEKQINPLEEHYSFVIEEPETNLFPKAQYDLIKFLEKERSDDLGKIDKGIIHTYTTHSPFILSSLNNMLYAHKKGSKASQKVKDNIRKILDEKYWIKPDLFSAYQIKDGKAISIMDRKKGLIRENVIDQVSEDIMGDFTNIGIASLQDNA